MNITANHLTYEKISEYYGKILKTKKDLKTSACCTLAKLPAYVQEPLKLIDEEIQTKYYGCGTPFPLVLSGMKILDLGCARGAIVLCCPTSPGKRAKSLEST